MWRFPRPARIARLLLRDRRGVSSLAFAGSALSVFGAVALATDAGLWYAARRAAQNAADAGATAAVMSLAMSDATQAAAVGRDLAARNGFTHGAEGGSTSVMVNIPPLSGPQAGNQAAVEVIVRQRQKLGAAALLVSAPPTVRGRAVATLADSSGICLLSLTGPLSLGGNTSVSAPECVMASNMRGTGSIQVSGNALGVRAFTLNAVGSCVNCTNTGVQLDEPFAEWRAPALNPFVRLNGKVMPTPSGRCRNGNNRPNSNLQPWEVNGQEVYCGDIRVNGGEVVNLQPGTYYIWNGSLIVLGGGTVQCPSCTGSNGVTIVATGDPSQIGGFQISANSTVNLRAPRISTDPDYNGVLLYRDSRATSNSTGSPPVDITGGPGVNLSGGIYSPSSHIRFIGNSSTLSCSVIVGGSIEFTGNAQLGNCATVGTTVPRTRVLVLAE